MNSILAVRSVIEMKFGCQEFAAALGQGGWPKKHQQINAFRYFGRCGVSLETT